MRAKNTIRWAAMGLWMLAAVLCHAQDDRRMLHREDAPAESKSAAPAVKLRAVALVELDGKGGAVLTPLTIYAEGRLFDANIYRLTPAPFALQGGAVYEGFQLGQSRGLFTLDGARRRNNLWFGVGRWVEARNGGTPEGDKAVAAAKAAREAVLAAERPVTLEDSDKPTLHRAPGSEGDAAKSPTPPAKEDRPAPTAKAAPPEDPDRPVLHRAPGSDANSKASDDGTFRVDVAKNGQVTPSREVEDKDAKPADDPERPRLHRKDEAQPAPTPSMRRDEAPAEDPNRPRLHYGKPTSAAVADPEVVITAALERRDYMVAVSDPNAAQQQSLRIQQYQWDTPQQQIEMQARLRRYAAAELRRTSARYLPPPPPPAARRGRQAPVALPLADPLAGELTEEKLSVFDPDFNNSPLLIYEALWKPAQAGQGYRIERGLRVTVVYRQESSAEPHRIFASVSDPTDLDARPELRFVDVVDLKGDGRAHLLFEQRMIEGRRFVFYHVWGDSLRESFTTLPR